MEIKTKKIITISILSLFLVSLVGVASAEVINIDASSYSVWDNFIHTLQGLGLFTAAGQSRECSTTSDYTISGVSGYVSTSSLLGSVNCDVALFNVFNKDWNFLSEHRSEDIGGFQIASDSTFEDFPAIIEVYCCPYEACGSDADCSSPPASNFGIYCNTNYGSCYGEEPAYITELFKCENDQWMRYGTASFGEDHYCNEGLNNYIDKQGAEHCVLSTYSSVTDGTWCGVEEPTPDPDSTPTPEILSGIIYDIQLFQDTFQQGEEVEVRFRVDNNGDAGNYLIEVGIIPKSVAEDWGFSYGGMAFSVFDWFTTVSTECCEGQPNIFAKTAYFNVQETNEFSITIPKAPYSEIADLCYDNNYWAGEGEYVLYVTMKTGCYPEGEEVTYETILIEINDTTIEPTPDIITKTLTWTEFYSMDDKKFSKGNYICSTTSDCPIKEGYTVTCDKDEVFRDRYYNYFLGTCDEALGWWDGIINNIITQIPGLAKVDICALNSMPYWESNWEESGGTCLAESDTWYGQLWDGSLKAMGGMGLPVQYVMIITVMLLMTLAGMIIRMVTR